jgi:hypothetical protein
MTLNEVKERGLEFYAEPVLGEILRFAQDGGKQRAQDDRKQIG